MKSKPALLLGLVAVTGWALAAGLAMRVYGYGLFAEGLLVANIIAIVVLSPAAGRCFTAMPLPHKTAFAILIFCMIVGQIVGNSYRTFPFSWWSMYSVKEPEKNDIKQYVLVGVDPASMETDIPPTRLFPSMSYSRMNTLIKRAVELALNEELDDRELHLRNLDELLVVLAGKHHQATGQLSQTVRIYAEQIPVRNPQQGRRRELVYELILEPFE